jgi:hypothetical protein
MGDPAQDFLESGGETSHPLDASNDPTNDQTIGKDPAQAFLESGGSAVHPLEKVDKSKADSPSYWEQYAQDEAEANTGASEAVLHAATGVGSSLLGGFRYAMGADRNLTPEQIERNKQSIVYQPRTEQGKGAAAAVDTAGSYLGQKEGEAAGPWATDAATRMGLPPSVAGAAGATAETLANVPQYLLPAALKRGGSGLPARISPEAPSVGPLARSPGTAVTAATAATEAPGPGPDAASKLPAPGQRLLPAPEPAPLTATGAERAPYFDINDPQAASELGIKPEKVEAQNPSSTGNLSPEQQAARTALAARIGLKEVRTSAITGDAQAAADDFDATKYTDDPMGDRMRGVIKNERGALVQHAEGIIDDLGAKQGTDQSTMIAKGKTMAGPLDALSDHIDAATTQAYEAAKEKGGTDPVQFPKLEAALRDKSLKNSLLAQGKEGFLQGVQSQWDDFKDNNPDGVNASVAEQYRQFLNTLWKTNPEAVGKLKDAMDTDMHAHFGENLFGDARQLHQLGKTLLEQPKGVAQIAGKDPNAPVNRTTDYEDIPNKIANMGGDQFKNLLNTYKMMPEELQPQAQAAIKEVQGHMVNRLLDAGSKVETQWNKKGVNTELSNNSENFKTAFADNPEAAAKIKDLKDAGEMLRFNSGYRGAHAQASNMLRKGIGAGAEAAGTGVGAGIGTFIAGPGTGTLAGGMAGKYLAGKGMGALDARAARKAVEGRVTQIP